MVPSAAYTRVIFLTATTPLAMRNALVVMVLLGAACTGATSRTSPDQAVQPAATATAIATPVEAAQRRFTRAQPVWAAPVDAYLSQYPDLSSQPPRCTIPPNVDVQVVSRDVGFRLMILDQATRDMVSNSGIAGASAGEDIAEVASTAGNCAGYVPASALQRA